MNDIINLHIENLYVEGFSESAGEEIGAELRSELSRLLNQPGMFEGLNSGGEPLHLDPGVITVTAGMSPKAIGGSIAQSLAGGILSQPSSQSER